MSASKWLVFHGRHGRCSLPLTDQNRDGIKALFCMSLIQTDATGTEHWQILAPWRKSPQGKMARRDYAAKYGRAALKQLLREYRG